MNHDIKTCFERLAGRWRRSAAGPAPLTLTIRGRTLRFRHCRDLAFALSARTAVPALRTHELLRHPVAALEAEAATLRELENRLQGALEDDEFHGIALSESLAAVDVRRFSKDHDWRAVFGELLGAEGARDAWLRVALRAYLGYLAARREVLRTVIRRQRAEAARAEARTAEAGFAPERATVARPAEELAAAAGPMRRLPQGEAVRISLGEKGTIDIRLARHTFSLSRGRTWCLCDRAGHSYPLRDGVNTVGRSRDNDISVDEALQNVSRRHLLAQPLGADVIELVDVSSAGTWVADKALAS